MPHTVQSPSDERSSTLLPTALALLVHAAFIVGLWRVLTNPGEDFASYRNATWALGDGADPYDPIAIAHYGNPVREGYPVHPFIYPPPSLVVLLWLRWVPEALGWPVFVVLMEACAVTSLLLWVQRAAKVDTAMVRAVCIVFVLMPTVWVNHLAGQINWLIVATTFGGLALASQANPWSRGSGGVLVGLAAAIKVGPVILLPWWALQRRWLEVIGGVLGVLALSLAAVPLVGIEGYTRFLTEVLPGVGRGEVPGLQVHLDDLSNSGPAPLLTRALGSHAPIWLRVWNLGLPLLALAACARTPTDAYARYAQPALLLAVMALTPAFVFEHHLVWLLPTFAALIWCLWDGRLGKRWAPVVGLAGVALWVPLPVLAHLSRTRPEWVDAIQVVQAIDCVGLLGLLAASLITVARPR